MSAASAGKPYGAIGRVATDRERKRHMNKTLKKLSALFFVSLFVLTACAPAFTAFAVGNPCGPNTFWSLTGKTLSITGSGAVNDYPKSAENPPPWYGKTYTKIVIGSQITRIGDYAFYDNAQLTQVTGGSNLLEIGNGAFDSTKWQENLPAGKVIHVGHVAYTYKGVMPVNTALALDGKTKGIAENAFYGQTGLTRVTIPMGVTHIGPSAFMNCTALKKVALPKSVTNIGEAAFGYYFEKNPQTNLLENIPIKGFKMYCTARSAAHRYAIANNFSRYVPPAPLSPKAAPLSSGGIRVNWSKADDYVTGYLVYRSLSETGGYALLGRAGKSARAYIDTTAQAGKTYYYKVFSCRSVLGAAVYSVAAPTVRAAG